METWELIVSVVVEEHNFHNQLNLQHPSLQMDVLQDNNHYYLFKIFLRFWLATITRVIHHNQLLLTKFGRILSYWTDDVKSAAKLQIIESLTEKTWGQVWVVFKVSNGEVAERFPCFTANILSKNMARTARRQLDGRHLLFGVYLQTWSALYLLNFPITMHYRYGKLNINRGKHVLTIFKLGIIFK